MSLAHLTLPTRDVEATAGFLERTLGYTRKPVPGNSPVEVRWLDIGRGQELHVFYVEDSSVAVRGRVRTARRGVPPPGGIPGAEARPRREGAVLVEPLRATPFERFFFREPVNGYVFEVVDQAMGRAARSPSPSTSTSRTSSAPAPC